MEPEVIFAVDPGTEKCGVAVVHEKEGCLFRAVVPAARIEETLVDLVGRFPGRTRLVMGDRTGSAVFFRRLEKAGVLERFGGWTWVDEHRSSEEARRLYLLQHRRGWRRLVPLGVQTPKEPIDGYVAEVLARRYLAGGRRNEGMAPD